MITLQASNTYTTVKYSSDLSFHNKIYNLLRTTLSYEVPSAEFSDKFKTGVWDGRISLYDGKNRRFPSGLTDLAIQAFIDNEVDFVLEDNRELPSVNKSYTVDYQGKELRDYQIYGPKLIKEATRGILEYGTGSGKTLCLCEIIHTLQSAPIIIIVPGTSLLRQTASELENYIYENNIPIQVGRIGGRFYDIKHNGINVCTYQSALAAFNMKERKYSLVHDEFGGDTVKKTISQLKKELKQAGLAKNTKLISKIQKQILAKEKSSANKASLQDLISEAQMLIVDECHLAAEIIEFISLKAEKAYYKIGLSATAFREDNQEIRIEGALGRILKTVSSSELISRGLLCKPTILMFHIHSKSACNGYQECYTKNIVNNDYRNNLIKDMAQECHKNGMPTVILVERIEHGNILKEIIPEAVFVPGKEKGDDDPDDAEIDYRRRMLNKLANNDHILIGTQWLYTGINVPEIQCMILAGSASSMITTYQQIGRCLRMNPGKNYALIVDFYDNNRYFKPHGAKRKKTYSLESEYELKMVKSA